MSVNTGIENLFKIRYQKEEGKKTYLTVTKMIGYQFDYVVLN